MMSKKAVSCIDHPPHQAEIVEDDEIKDIESTPHRHGHKTRPVRAVRLV